MKQIFEAIAPSYTLLAVIYAIGRSYLQKHGKSTDCKLLLFNS